MEGGCHVSITYLETLMCLRIEFVDASEKEKWLLDKKVSETIKLIKINNKSSISLTETFIVSAEMTITSTL